MQKRKSRAIVSVKKPASKKQVSEKTPPKPRHSKGSPSELKLLPLLRNQYRTKIYGLRVLRTLFPHITLPYLSYREPEQFSLRHFDNIEHGRMLIRTDPIRNNHVQTMEEWFSVPRLNLSLFRQPAKASERQIKAWMKKVKKKHPFVRFIVHKVRPLQDYERSVQVNVDIENNQVILTTTKARTDRFRDEMETRSTTMILDPNRKIRRELGITRPLLPSVLMQNTVSRLQRLVDYAGLTEHKRFETSFVTYRDNPHTPEFYDLVFGKSI